MNSIIKTATLLISVAVLAFGSYSCNTVKPIDKTKLDGYWTLKSIKGENAKDAFKGINPNLQLNFEKNAISGNGGCNSFSGAFTLTDKNEFSVSNITATAKACLQDNKESLFFSTLSAPGLLVSLDDAGELTFSKNDSIMLSFIKGDAEADKPGIAITAERIAGKWNLTAITDKDVNSLYQEKKPTMEIATDGKVLGYAGCNTYRTTFELKDDIITFKPAAMTRKACPNMEGEQIFAGLLNNPLQVAIFNDKLRFFKEGIMVLEFTKNTESK